MAELLGLGITHYPPLLGAPDAFANLLRIIMTSDLVPEKMKQVENWPGEMQQEYESEVQKAAEHQERHIKALAEVRRRIDDFNPDAVIMFGDDQYENFKEDVIPPFNIYCMDSFHSRPFEMLKMLGDPPNIWGVDSGFAYDVAGNGILGRSLAHAIIESDCPIAYSYKYANHDHLSHAFANACVYLDWDQKGWPYPIIPISVNCYGTGVIKSRGGFSHLLDKRPMALRDPYLDAQAPAGPTPRSCFNVGQALRDALEHRDERIVVMASSGWSHAFLVEKHSYLYPDREFDAARVSELRNGDQANWASLTNNEVESAGSQEFKNWICLAGVFPERQAQVIEYLDTWIFNSQKCFAVFES
ncbi:MAG: hypothetical protein P8L31_08890 [Pseudomonadales bacterium]|nr:hypothetical protein [Pseudomonadales bacterium]